MCDDLHVCKRGKASSMTSQEGFPGSDFKNSQSLLPLDWGEEPPGSSIFSTAEKLGEDTKGHEFHGDGQVLAQASQEETCWGFFSKIPSL